MKRHYTEDVFGVQLAGAHANTLGACAELLTQKFDIDFIDLNCGCPIDLVCQDGAGSQLLARKQRLESICKTMVDVMGDTPFTIKIRTGVLDKQPTAHTLIPNLQSWGVSAVTVCCFLFSLLSLQLLIVLPGISCTEDPRNKDTQNWRTSIT